MAPTLSDPSLTPPGGSEVLCGPIRGRNVIESDYLLTRIKLLLITSQTKGLMGSTQSGPRKPLLGVPEAWSDSAGPKCLSVGFSRNESRMTCFGLKTNKNMFGHPSGPSGPLLGVPEAWSDAPGPKCLSVGFSRNESRMTWFGLKINKKMFGHPTAP